MITITSVSSVRRRFAHLSMSEPKTAARGVLPANLRGVGKPEAFGTGQFVFRVGDPVRGVFAVQSGEVRLLRYGRDGREIVVQRAVGGDFIAEASLDSPRYRCYAVAERPTRLLVFPKDALLSLFASDRVFAGEWIALLSGQLHHARARLERMALKTSAERLLHYLHTEGRGARCEVTLSTSLKDIARELGITHEALYRTLSRLEREGTIRRAEGRISLR
jgi:CRP-like cAMP-binding protein